MRSKDEKIILSMSKKNPIFVAEKKFRLWKYQNSN